MGRFQYEYSTFKLALHGPLSVLGRSVVVHKFQDDLGLEGIIRGNTFTSYDSMTTEQLKWIVGTLGYEDVSQDRSSLLGKLKKESKTTGNASTRLAGTIIGLKK